MDDEHRGVRYEAEARAGTPAPAKGRSSARRAGALAIGASALLAFGPGGPARAQDAAGAAAGSVAAELPVTRVVLFTSGIGYFEHAGTVEGTRELELSVPSGAMDDLLGSLVLQDLDGGSIRPVRYASSDPLERVLGGYALDLSGDPGLAELLSQARGEAVRLELAPEGGAAAGAGEAVEGTLVHVERVARPDDEPRTWLTLATDAGLRRVPLDAARLLRFEDEALRGELDAALAAIARHRGADERSLRLAFAGEGERRVRVGYVREMPMWKTTWRLVLDGAGGGGEGGAALQGWAIADNPTATDLTDVRLSFVAGRPISFIPDLVAPVYVPRPRVAVDVGPSVVPRADGGAMPMAAPAPMAAMEEPEAFAAGRAADAAPFSAGVEEMSEGARMGASFEYAVTEPVTVARHESAMIPIVDRRVAASRLSLYDASVLTGHPLRAVRLDNDTGLLLAAGPVAVFDAGGFAGEARIGDVPPGESRLLGYAVDLDVRVEGEEGLEPERVIREVLVGGAIETSVLQRLRTAYRIDASAEGDRFLVVEHPRRPGFEVVAPAPPPAETARGARFGVLVPGRTPGAAGDPVPEGGDVPVHLRCAADGACVLEVVEERVESRRFLVADLPTDRLAAYVEGADLPEGDRAALARILDLRRRLAGLEREVHRLETDVAAIARDQERIRGNMGALDRDSELYGRYVGQLGAQEDELAAIRSDLAELRAEREAVRAELDAALLSLTGDGG